MDVPLESKCDLSSRVETLLDTSDIEKEWDACLKEPNIGSIAISTDEAAKRICDGFKMYNTSPPPSPLIYPLSNCMNMTDASTGNLMWESGEW
jgi:hypothetical protein